MLWGEIVGWGVLSDDVRGGWGGGGRKGDQEFYVIGVESTNDESLEKIYSVIERKQIQKWQFSVLTFPIISIG